MFKLIFALLLTVSTSFAGDISPVVASKQANMAKALEILTKYSCGKQMLADSKTTALISQGLQLSQITIDFEDCRNHNWEMDNRNCIQFSHGPAKAAGAKWACNLTEQTWEMLQFVRD